MQGIRMGEREGGVVNQAGTHKVITKHRCAVCGRTELDDDMLEFRFCSGSAPSVRATTSTAWITSTRTRML